VRRREIGIDSNFPSFIFFATVTHNLFAVPKAVNVSQFAKSVFYLRIINEKGDVDGNTKIIISQ
jgi:hypothetical protein